MSRNSTMNDILGQLLGGARQHSGELFGERTDRRSSGSIADLLGGGGGAGGLGGLLGGLLGGGGSSAGSGGGIGDLLKKGGDMLSGPDGKPGLGHAGAAAALGMLLGSKQGRSLAGKGLVLGGLAYLGKKAYDAYAQNQSTTAPAPDAQPIDQLSGDEADARGATMLAALIAAAKADGHIDEQEKSAILQAAQGLGEEGRQILSEELQKPLDAREIAALADSDQSRREIYALSVMMTGGDDSKERAYLDELADALALPREVTRALDAEARVADAPA